MRQTARAIMELSRGVESVSTPTLNKHFKSVTMYIKDHRRITDSKFEILIDTRQHHLIDPYFRR